MKSEKTKRTISPGGIEAIRVVALKWVAGLAIGFILSTSPVVAQKLGRPVLLEANVSMSGMAAPQGQHLYVRVFKDGKIEYEDEVIEGSSSRFILRRAKLSRAKLTALVNFLKSPGIINLAKEYPPARPPLDHVIELTVTIGNNEQLRTVVITNFLPTPSKVNQIYPSALVDLLCRIERLRKKVSFGITADPAKWCAG